MIAWICSRERNPTSGRFLVGTNEWASQFSQRLDTNHVGVVGHSRGGWSAIVACRRDERIKACVNEDGNAGGQGLQYPGASIPKQSNLYVEVSSFCKALLKKSASAVLSASNRFSLLTSLRSLLSREFCFDKAITGGQNGGGGFIQKCLAEIFVPSTSASGGSSRYRQVYSRPRLTPSSRDSLVMFSQAFILATARRRNFCLYRSFYFLSTLQLLSCKPIPIDFIR